ncbi:MAG TPA: FlgD immunoglobulin-like domain containing protein [Candidatus Eisenbacteria bacterium]|nr:FlgD immunoglobulin-like domain containing protein [Candidatus Eisenbacteria bacterium]
MYDVTGRLVRVILDRDLPTGTHEATWDGKDEAGAVRASGVYFYELRAGSYVGRRRMVLLR